jgi:hypothetical protein
MKAPVHYSGGRVRYTGRLAYAQFVAWAASPRGSLALERVASRIRFSLFGKARAARRRAWKQVSAAARDEAVAVTAQREADRFLRPLQTFVHGRGLPSSVIDLYRLVVVPRVFLNAECSRRLDAALVALPSVATLDAGEPLRDWFVLTVVSAIDKALAGARPSIKRPLAAGDEWMVAGVDDEFSWSVPLEGPAWPGHYYVLEMTRAPMSRAFRKAVGEKMARLDESMQSLSRAERTEILRQAGSSLSELVVRDTPLIARAR